MKKSISLEKVTYIVNVNSIVPLYFSKRDHFYFWLSVSTIAKSKTSPMRDADSGTYLKGRHFWKSQKQRLWIILSSSSNLYEKWEF